MEDEWEFACCVRVAIQLWLALLGRCRYHCYNHRRSRRLVPMTMGSKIMVIIILKETGGNGTPSERVQDEKKKTNKVSAQNNLPNERDGEGGGKKTNRTTKFVIVAFSFCHYIKRPLRRVVTMRLALTIAPEWTQHRIFIFSSIFLHMVLLQAAFLLFVNEIEATEL